MRRILIALALTLIAPVVALAASAPLKVLTYETKPFFYKDGGHPTGLEYEILEYYAKTSGRSLDVHWTTSWETIVDEIVKGHADVAGATMTITPERLRQVDFSTPYFPVRVMLVEPRDKRAASLAELAGATLATIKGTTYEEILSNGVPRAQMTYGTVEEDLFKLVVAGKARAAAADSAIALALLPRYPQLHLGIPLSPQQGFGYAVQKGSPLAADISKTIAQLKESKIYYRLLEKYLGAEAAKLVAAGKD